MDVAMIYIFDEDASKEFLSIRGETHKYLVKVRRHKVGDVINFRNKEDLQMLYTYEITELDGRSLELKLVSSAFEEVKSTKALHIGWCVIDMKSIEKVLPSLSEIGVSKISFISCERSQNNFKLDFNRFERILEASMQQSGRSTFIEFETYKNVKEFIKAYPQTKVFDFCENVLKDGSNIETVLIGCEGGFSKEERTILSTQDNFRLNTPMVLRSESAVLAVASKVLL
ncbi:MAG: 16S rRNA (uracil(1498)-N(3))-methyltransferase [Sulfurimonas sp.]|nr:16S rRNA (uracil(1498)-N(3))-methyltransferase [Sulfurimonas sp.]MBU1217086.1 16S rRNA (uracil(1498)-N(3))-methyltransferase [bacterium]MBU1435355.1 16S rRNA (uracil(1498)-N(3))-methyltransferase [bacterium]MBU1502334.1 16S rRNA (uracil(1498)-N(3))-methyltransferase [bacterium]MBU3939562.1 16S rRNA (uracil(1498)-N(3))-methyltransferase [bacterium]